MRRFFDAAATCSLFCSVALGALWVRSFYVRDAFEVCHVDVQPKDDVVHNWWVKSARGGLKFEQDISTYVSGEGAKMPLWHRDTSDATFYPFFGTLSSVPGRNHLTIWQRAGFDLSASSTGTPPDIIRGFIVPLWFIVPLFLILPFLRFRAYMNKNSSRRTEDAGSDSAFSSVRRVVSAS